MTTLYHYTCDDGHAAIGKVGVLRPGPDGLIWLTDMRTPNRDALGLTMHILKCDRTRHRYRVTDPSYAVPWIEYRKTLDDPWWRAELEFADGARPRHWFVTTAPVPVEYDPIPRRSERQSA